MPAALLVLLSLTQSPPPPPHWTLQVNSDAWCGKGQSGPCALHKLQLDERKAQPVALPPGAPWRCTAGEVKAVGMRYFRTITCTNDGGKTAVRATALLDDGKPIGAEVSLDWKPRKGRGNSVVLALDVAP